jgi:hypothetical protein
MDKTISALTASYTRCLPTPLRYHWDIFNEKYIKMGLIPRCHGDISEIWNNT